MSEDRARSAFRIAPRVLAAPGSLVAEAFAGGRAANLFRAVIQPGSVGGAGVYRPGRIGPEAFVATSARARAKLEAILGGDGQLVTTGQQPGLFLGPLYTLYKTATAIQLAAELERSTDRPMLAAFWVAADDHDWDEIGVCRIL
ncbi:MAG: bacillithiol biosynthesis BshC, partial [Gemmatimonadota bacterium]